MDVTQRHSFVLHESLNTCGPVSRGDERGGAALNAIFISQVGIWSVGRIICFDLISGLSSE